MNYNDVISLNSVSKVCFWKYVLFKGQYACKLINLGVNGSDISVVRTNITIWATTIDNEVSSKRLNITFLPGVHVEKEVVLSNAVGEMSVIGLPEVLNQIKVGDQ